MDMDGEEGEAELVWVESEGQFTRSEVSETISGDVAPSDSFSSRQALDISRNAARQILGFVREQLKQRFTLDQGSTADPEEWVGEGGGDFVRHLTGGDRRLPHPLAPVPLCSAALVQLRSQFPHPPALDSRAEGSAQQSRWVTRHSHGQRAFFTSPPLKTRRTTYSAPLSPDTLLRRSKG